MPKKEFSLEVKQIPQSDCAEPSPNRCGAACVQMVLQDIDPVSPDPASPNPERDNRYQNQETLSTAIRSADSNTTWYSSPNGIASVLNSELSEEGTRRGRFVIRRSGRPGTEAPPLVGDRLRPQSPRIIVNPLDSLDFRVAQRYQFEVIEIPKAYEPERHMGQFDSITRLLIRMISVLGVAPIIAVREDNAHWVVVNGYEVDRDFKDLPGFTPDLASKYQIQKIKIRNPLGRYAYIDVAGRKVINDGERHCTETQDEIQLDTWNREYLFDDWGESFFLICDHNDRVKADFVPVASRLAEPTTVSERLMISTFQKLPEVAPIKAKELARDFIKQLKLSPWGKNGTAPATGDISDPVRVKRLDRIDGDYYLVPVKIDKRISVLINMSVTGVFQETTFWPKGNFDLLQGQGLIDQKMYIGKSVRVSEQEPLLQITSLRYNPQEPRAPFAWRPCYESYSSFKPFHNFLAKLSDGREIPFFIPVDDLRPRFTTPDWKHVVEECIRAKANKPELKLKIGDLRISLNRRGSKVLVMYQSDFKKSDFTLHADLLTLESSSKPGDKELYNMIKYVICPCLQAHPRTRLTHFRVKVFSGNAFLTSKRGGGEDEPLSALPPPGGGSGNNIEIGTCK
jgi:hypothetical protein